MNIWTERLERRHLPLAARWLARAECAVTRNDLPPDAAMLAQWYDRCAAEPGRLDCLAMVYETPVGLTGLRRLPDGTAELWLLLGETGYNPLRTATYLALRMLDRAFLELGEPCAAVRLCAGHEWFLAPLERMGFRSAAKAEGVIALTVDKESFLQQKYLF